MHGFIGLHGLLGRVKHPKPQQSRSDTAFNCLLVLFPYIVQVFAWPKDSGCQKRSLRLAGLDGHRLCSMLVDRDHPRCRHTAYWSEGVSQCLSLI